MKIMTNLPVSEKWLNFVKLNDNVKYHCFYIIPSTLQCKNYSI